MAFSRSFRARLTFIDFFGLDLLACVGSLSLFALPITADRVMSSANAIARTGSPFSQRLMRIRILSSVQPLILRSFVSGLFLPSLGSVLETFPTCTPRKWQIVLDAIGADRRNDRSVIAFDKSADDRQTCSRLNHRAIAIFISGGA